MELAIQIVGTGARTAVLVHGIMSAGSAWHRVAADLVLDGYRVVTVDLAGHGSSGRAASYSPQAWADDVVETVAPLLAGPSDLLIGHSLGALVASLAAERLGARALVYIEPAFAFPRGPLGVAYKVVFGLMPRPRRAALALLNPRWDARDLDIEVQTLREWDRRTLWAFADTTPLRPPAVLLAPSLAIVGERSFLVTARVRRTLETLGMRVVTLAGTGHTVHRDDHAAVMRTIRDWRSLTGGSAPSEGYPRPR